MNLCEDLAVLNFSCIIAKGTPTEIQFIPFMIEACLGKQTRA